MSTQLVRISGSKFYRGEERFIVKGIVYQPQDRTRISNGSRDPLADQCIDELRQNLIYLKDLGINALWIYTFDPDLPHDACMNLLAENGIYIIAGLTNNQICITRNDPLGTYSVEVLAHYTAVTDCLAAYDNVIGVCVANGLVNGHSARPGLFQETCQALSLAISDLKDHMASRYQNPPEQQPQQRILPICVSDTEWALLNTDSFQRLRDPYRSKNQQDPSDDNENDVGFVDGTGDGPDFYAFSYYESQTPTSASSLSTPLTDSNNPPPFQKLHLLPKFHNITPQIPILISEYSNDSSTRPRSFDQVTALYSRSASSSSFSTDNNLTSASSTETPDMIDVFSGGFVYEFSEEVNRYGLVKTSKDGSVELTVDYEVFKEKLKGVS